MQIFVFVPKIFVGKGSHENICSLVNSSYTKCIERFKAHNHKKCTAPAEHFLNVLRMKTDSVASQVDMHRKKQVAENREALKRQFLMGKISFLYKARDTILKTLVQFPWKIQITRIYRVPLRFRANSGDNKLKSHLLVLNSPRKNTYVSAVIKNEILDISSKIIQNKIVKKANTSGAFTIIADKTLDVCYTVHDDLLTYCTYN